MASNFLYCRPPCSSLECNGTMWRYQDIVATPIPGQYQAQPCARLSPERQRQSYQASHEDMSMSRPSTGKYGYVSTPITNYNMRDKFRWPYPSQPSRGTRQSCTEVRTNPEKRKFCHLFDSCIQEKVSSIQETSFAFSVRWVMTRSLV